jgi:hypothetical protein
MNYGALTGERRNPAPAIAGTPGEARSLSLSKAMAPGPWIARETAMESKHLLPSLSEHKVVSHHDSSALTERARASWRADLPIHRAAETFPLMSSDKRRTLGEDIAKNGLTSSIVLWQADPKSPVLLLDGRNRLDAIEANTGCQVQVVLKKLKRSRTTITKIWSIKAGDWIRDDKVVVLDGSVDPYSYVVSVNFHRRHLTPEQKREGIANLIKATPDKSDRQIAEMLRVSPTTVGTVRREMEATGNVSKLDTRTDTKGRKQPATRRQTKWKPNAEPIDAADAAAVFDAAASNGESAISETKTASETPSEAKTELTPLVPLWVANFNQATPEERTRGFTMLDPGDVIAVMPQAMRDVLLAKAARVIDDNVGNPDARLSRIIQSVLSHIAIADDAKTGPSKRLGHERAAREKLKAFIAALQGSGHSGQDVQIVLAAPKKRVA